jgi:hypothetical protein
MEWLGYSMAIFIIAFTVCAIVIRNYSWKKYLKKREARKKNV